MKATITSISATMTHFYVAVNMSGRRTFHLHIIERVQPPAPSQYSARLVTRIIGVSAIEKNMAIAIAIETVKKHRIAEVGTVAQEAEASHLKCER